MYGLVRLLSADITLPTQRAISEWSDIPTQMHSKKENGDMITLDIEHSQIPSQHRRLVLTMS